MDKIAVLDCGGQYTHLIARKVRELGVYSEILPAGTPSEKLSAYHGVILSGGPASVYDPGSPQVDPKLFDAGVPVLGICYGHQLIAHALKGKVTPSQDREFGMTTLEVSDTSTLLRGLDAREPVWMSHGDLVDEPPEGFQVLASTPTCRVAAMGDPARRIYGVQFHVEVTHTRKGREVLANFLKEVCRCPGGWTAGDRVPQLEEHVRQAVGGRRVFFFVSGGVDSTVAFTLCVRALAPGQVHGAYIDTGFMRQNESQEIGAAFHDLGYDVEIVDARARFAGALAGVVDPEEKRRRIGEMFIAVQDEAITRMGWTGDWMLGQGTIYPDTIESGGTAAAAKIKTHHNRVGRVEEMIRAGRVVEPIAELYKDEVRQVARRLNLPSVLIDRHPFPGPGLAIRCLCSDHEEDCQPLPANGHGYSGLLLPIRSVGVQGDFRTYAHPTLLWDGQRSHDRLAETSTAITNATRSTNRVTYLLDCRVPPAERRWRVHPADLSAARIAALQEADARVRAWLKEEGLEGAVWQFPVVLLPLGAERGESIVLRPVESVDGMTAQYAHLDFAALARLTPRLLALPEIEAVLLDISNKPPATIEWE
jgi:GMP synthase (glutamine-hydrolysing)